MVNVDFAKLNLQEERVGVVWLDSFFFGVAVTKAYRYAFLKRSSSNGGKGKLGYIV